MNPKRCLFYFIKVIIVTPRGVIQRGVGFLNCCFRQRGDKILDNRYMYCIQLKNVKCSKMLILYYKQIFHISRCITQHRVLLYAESYSTQSPILRRVLLYAESYSTQSPTLRGVTKNKFPKIHNAKKVIPHCAESCRPIILITGNKSRNDALCCFCMEITQRNNPLSHRGGGVTWLTGAHVAWVR